ncbi:GNAT family N-acetyltransferase [Candidatus Roizmanbacteria bacterium]|nr:GNAT family N-acetyltransferase [Candidatus Roizmanbacteria bacterium]
MTETIQPSLIEYKIASTNHERQQAFAVRHTVFVEEQNVPIDIERDEFDEAAIHIIATKNGIPVGTGRLVIETDEAGRKRGRIGRVCILKANRRQGIATGIMKEILKQAQQLPDLKELYLHAQLSAKELYAGLGYVERGEVFAEAGIDHIEMFKSINHTS